MDTIISKKTKTQTTWVFHIFVISSKQPDCVQELLQNAADPNIKNKSGLTALVVAIDHPDIDSVQCLVHYNADVSIAVCNNQL